MIGIQRVMRSSVIGGTIDGLFVSRADGVDVPLQVVHFSVFKRTQSTFSCLKGQTRDRVPKMERKRMRTRVRLKVLHPMKKPGNT